MIQSNRVVQKIHFRLLVVSLIIQLQRNNLLSCCFLCVECYWLTKQQLKGRVQTTARYGSISPPTHHKQSMFWGRKITPQHWLSKFKNSMGESWCPTTRPFRDWTAVELQQLICNVLFDRLACSLQGVGSRSDRWNTGLPTLASNQANRARSSEQLHAMSGLISCNVRGP